MGTTWMKRMVVGQDDGHLFLVSLELVARVFNNA